MAPQFPINETRSNPIINALINIASNATDYAASSVMDYLNNSTQNLSDNNTTKTSIESFRTINVAAHTTPAGDTTSESPVDILIKGCLITLGVVIGFGYIYCCIRMSNEIHRDS